VTDSPSARPPRGRGLLVVLVRLPRPALLIGVLAVVLAGLLLPGWLGACFLLALAALLAWLLSLGWPVLSPATRLARVLTIFLLVAYAGWKALASS
jgi:hypothetical protein